MEPRKYFLDKRGASTFRVRGASGTGHYDIGKQVLAEHVHQPLAGKSGSDYATVYTAMFQLGYARVVETERELEVESAKPLSGAQKRFLQSKKSEGKLVRMIPCQRREPDEITS